DLMGEGAPQLAGSAVQRWGGDLCPNFFLARRANSRGGWRLSVSQQIAPDARGPGPALTKRGGEAEHGADRDGDGGDGKQRGEGGRSSHRGSAGAPAPSAPARTARVR